jgi:vanillate O-demethylase monooxygenase subunit
VEKPRFLANTWYVAALATEVDATALFHRKILGTSVLIYRKQDGVAVALHDRCPHRFAPLHLGKRIDDDVLCPYHALRFDCSGQCVHSPHGNGLIPRAASVRQFPLVERDGFLWIWMGDAAAADPSLIIDCSRLTRNPPAAVAHAYMYMKANYEVVVDNIMDLSHIDHVHGPLINTAGKLSPLIPAVSEDERAITIRWEWQQHPAMLLLAPFLPQPDEQAEQYFEVKWHAPSNMSLEVGAVQGSRKYDQGLVIYDWHLMTPETATTTHYYFGSTRNYKMDDAPYNDAKLAGMIEAFSTEDKPLIAAVQEEMDTTDLWALKPVLLSCDAGAVRARRRLKALMDAETAASASVAA